MYPRQENYEKRGIEDNGKKFLSRRVPERDRKNNQKKTECVSGQCMEQQVSAHAEFVDHRVKEAVD